MSVIDITTFACSVCANAIPDRELENTTVKLSEMGIGIVMVCNACVLKRGGINEKLGVHTVDDLHGYYRVVGKT